MTAITMHLSCVPHDRVDYQDHLFGGMMKVWAKDSPKHQNETLQPRVRTSPTRSGGLSVAARSCAGWRCFIARPRNSDHSQAGNYHRCGI